MIEERLSHQGDLSTVEGSHHLWYPWGLGASWMVIYTVLLVTLFQHNCGNPLSQNAMFVAFSELEFQKFDKLKLVLLCEGAGLWSTALVPSELIDISLWTWRLWLLIFVVSTCYCTPPKIVQKPSNLWKGKTTAHGWHVGTSVSVAKTPTSNFVGKMSVAPEMLSNMLQKLWGFYHLRTT